MSESVSAPAMAPVQAKDRVEAVDILRGLALLMILVENMASYRGAPYSFQGASGALERMVVALILFLLQAKSYSLFAFLFGWGVAVQMQRTESQGARFGILHLRRMLVLLVLGILHGTLIWYGDVLTVYALLGLLLFPLRKCSGRVLGAVIALSLLIPIVLNLPFGWVDNFRGWYDGQVNSWLRSGPSTSSLYAQGSYATIAGLRIQSYLRQNVWAVYYGGTILSMFVLGLYVGRRKVLQEASHHVSLIRKVLWTSLVVGVACNAIFLLESSPWAWQPPLAGGSELVRVASRTFGAPALMLFYVCAVVLLFGRESWRRRLAPLLAVGRMSLTNYLSQSLLCTLIFYGYGLGLYGQVSMIPGLILAGLLFMFQIRVSEWWLERHPFGPVEWLWRVATYGRLAIHGRRLAHPDPQGMPSLPARASLTGTLRRVVREKRIQFALASFLVVLLAAGGIFYWRLHVPAAPAVAETRPAAGTRADTESRPDGGAVTPSPVVATPVVQPVQRVPGQIAASGDLWALASTLSIESMLDRIRILTGPPYYGRYAGSPEGWAAGDYIAGLFAEYGLQPAGEDVLGKQQQMDNRQLAAAHPSFFQPFPIEYVALADMPGLVVREADGDVHDQYVLYEDYTPVVRWYSGAGTAEGEVVWASNCDRADLASVRVTGKIVLCRDVAFQEAQRNALEHGAAGLLLLTDPEQRPADRGNVYLDVWVPVPIPTFRIYPDVAVDLLAGSGRTVEDLTIRFESFPLSASAKMRVSVTGSESCPNRACRGRNILGVLPGRDPRYADQVVIVGAHYDHLGQGPDGTVWKGANDNASGVALLLEIARSWHEQGYVPRRTVLFAAWDAEEMGLLGSQYYVRHPRYLLENTVAMLQLDMVGAGDEPLCVDGSGDLATKLYAMAESIGIEVTISNAGRSDHVPFLAAGVPASLLIWSFGEDASAPYHRPLDIAEAIDPAKLGAVTRIAGVTLLSLCEGEPAINDLLTARADALGRGDLDAFLDTSMPEVVALERAWFADARGTEAASPVLVQAGMWASGFRVSQSEINATVHVTVGHRTGEEASTEARPDGASSRVEKADVQVRFVHGEEGWKWAGPGLVWAYPESSRDGGQEQKEGIRPFAVGRFELSSYPSGTEIDADGLGRLAASQYAELAARLGLPVQADASVLLFPTSRSLEGWAWESSQVGDPNLVVDPGVVRMVYIPDLENSPRWQAALTQLVLAEAGVTERAAPWLWEGLPLVLGAQDARRGYDLGDLQQALSAEPDAMATSRLRPEAESAMAWAAVEYLRHRLGWQGVGQFIRALGNACREQRVTQDADSLNAALLESLNVDAAAFDAAWRDYWREQLGDLQHEIDAVLAARMEAVISGDQERFLKTVNDHIPALLEEEQHWFERVMAADQSFGPMEDFSLEGRPVALLEDGSILASVTMHSQWREAAEGEHGGSPRRQCDEGSTPWTVLLTPADDGYRWSGTPLRVLQGSEHGEGEHGGSPRLVSLLYPAGEYDIAQALLVEAEAIYGPLAQRLGVEQRPLVIKLYDDDQAFRASIEPCFPLSDWAPGWSERDGSVKIRLGAMGIGTKDSGREAMGGQAQRPVLTEPYRSDLVMQLARRLLYEAGVESEWFIKGLGMHLAKEMREEILRSEQGAGMEPHPDGSPGSGLAYAQDSASLKDLLEAVEKGKTYPLNSLPLDHELSADEHRIVRMQVQDTFEYLTGVLSASAEGDVLWALLERQEQGSSLDTAMQETIGRTLEEFEAGWADSLARAHAQEQWIDVSQRFDPQRVLEHIAYLSSPELSGRQPGSPGAAAAAAYIADKFAEYGLVPVGRAGAETRPDGGNGETSFLQHFPISYTAWLSGPRFEVWGEAEGENPAWQAVLVHREDWSLYPGTALGGVAAGELVLVQDPEYTSLKLDGKVVVRATSGAADREAALAAQHGASALILLAQNKSTKGMLSKQPLPVTWISDAGGGIPVLQLSSEGYAHLLEWAGYGEGKNGVPPRRGGVLPAVPAVPLGVMVRIEIPLSLPETVDTANVLGLLLGSDPRLNKELVIVGAHYDHVGDDPDLVICHGPGEATEARPDGRAEVVCEQVQGKRYPGTNDDASGVGVMLEIARLWHEAGYWPRRSILFAAWGAQEAGEVGSRYYTEHPVYPLEETVAVLQLDAVGGGEGYFLEARGGPEKEGTLQFRMQIAAERVEGRLTLAKAVDGSDHVPFRELGIPALLVTWREASEDNWPSELADEVQEYRIGVTGRVTALALMMTAQ